MVLSRAHSLGCTFIAGWFVMALLRRGIVNTVSLTGTNGLCCVSREHEASLVIY